MRRACLHVLVLLVSLMATKASPGGEICHYWSQGVESPAGAFQCPELGKWDDDTGATFCCGTCSAPYCCSSVEAWLEQDRCPGEEQLLVSSVPQASHHSPTSFYIGVGLTAATLLGIAAFFIYIKICQPLRARIRARRQVRQLDMPPSRVSFQDPSPTFIYGIGTRLQAPNPPPIYHAFTRPLRRASPPPPSHAERPAQPGQEVSAQPGNGAASFSPTVALLDPGASNGTPEPEE